MIWCVTMSILPVAWLWLAAPSALGANTPDERGDSAERMRLHDELALLAKRKAWSGVERLYRKLEALGPPIARDDHLLAAEAARAEGNVLSAVHRLELAAAEPLPAPEADD